MNNMFEHKVIKSPQAENHPIPVDNLDSAELTDSEPIDVRLNILNDYLRQCEDNGVIITPEMAAKEFQEKLGLEITELLDQEIVDSEVQRTNQNLAGEIEALMSQKATNQKTTLSYLRETIFKSNFAKAAFVTAMLFLKFNAGQAASDHTKDKVQNKTEHQKPVNLDGGNDQDQSYDSHHDFHNTEKVTIKAGSFFETDKADLKNQPELKDKFDNFFSSINSANFDKIMSHNWIFASSSDERKTSKWGGSNKNLSDARFESFSKMFEEAKNSHDFSGLSADQIKQIAEKSILSVQPVGGETRITDLVNPETNKNFTAKEEASLSASNRAKLLEQCRYANFEVESSMFDIGTFGQFILLVDNSPSMEKSKVNMADELKYVNENMPVKVGFFSDDLNNFKELNSSQAAAVEILKVPSAGSATERALSSAITYLEKISPEDISSKTMYVATDEGLQDVNKILQLMEKAKSTNTEVTFLMFYENGSKFIKISAKDLLDKYQKNIEANIVAQQETLNKNITSYEKKIGSIINDIEISVNNGSFEAGNMYDALALDGIKGSREEIKKALLEADWQNLENFKNIYLGGKLVKVKQNLMFDKELLTKMHAPLEQQLADNLSDKSQFNQISKLTTFEDARGNIVEMPISR